jgi:serine/threonine protein kinase
MADRDSLIENAESVSIDDFNLLKVLGSGAFGKVFLVEKKNKIPGKKNKLYAMKALRKDFIISNNQIAHTMTERRILEEINSPFIVKLAYAFQSDDKLYFVMEYVQGGELFFHLRQRGKFTEE